MDAAESQMPSAAPHALDPSARPAQRLSPQRKPASQKTTQRDGRYRRTSPRSGGSGTVAREGTLPLRTGTKGSVTRMASVTGKPLVPVTERRSQDKSLSRGKKDSEHSSWDLAPDGGSAGRAGRQFAVANVGNNGRIYLRPTVRPAHQRLPQPNFTFPITPPETAVFESAAGQHGQEKTTDEPGTASLLNPWSPTPGASPLSNGQQYFPDLRQSHRPFNHRRALSDSTIHEPSIARESDNGAFKVVISKPFEEQRPRTMEDLDPNAPPLLKINIPSWRIGTPRFTLRGTPMFRASSYAPTEDGRTSGITSLNLSQQNVVSESTPRKPSPLAIPRYGFSPANQSPALSPGFPTPRGHQARFTYLSTIRVIEPAMFDDLTFKPARDKRSIVRYAAHSGAVTAATPPRLVAEITSPSFLDYELISDFFLTYRSFLESEHLLKMLIARLRWAIDRPDEIGMVVRVRTFVAMRHWILNYFMDDFVVDYGLRVTFCTLLNDLSDEFADTDFAHKQRVRILGEVKKCWRRVCAQYWDGPEFDDEVLESEAAIAPGGIAGHRDPTLDPTFWEKQEIGPPQLDSLFCLRKSGPEPSDFIVDIPKAGTGSDSVVLRQRPSTPEERPVKVSGGHAFTTQPGEDPISPMSQASMDVVSCSFPGMGTRNMNPHPSHPLAAHPIPEGSAYNQAALIATTPKALVGKRVRPDHRRSNSLTDSLRDRDSEKVSIKDQEFLMTPPFSGSLVRGNCLPPGQPFVDVSASRTGNEGHRDTTIFHGQPRNEFGDRAPGGAMSGRGMKKLLNGVRRALSTRVPTTPSQGQAFNMQPLGPRGATTNRVPGTAVVPQNPSTTRIPVRIDLLGASVAEDFKKAVREEQAADAERRGFPLSPPAEPGYGHHDLDYSAAHKETTKLDDLLPPQRQMAGLSHATGITTGSQSIVIVDDTVPDDEKLAENSLSTVSPSVDTFADTFMPAGADLTPPNTPPAELERDIPRRSSYLLNQHVVQQPAMEEESLPPFVPDLATLGRSESQAPRASEEKKRPPLSMKTRGSRHHGVSAKNSFRHHRNKSSRTQQSISSILHQHQRNASYSSGVVPPSTARSFDATTYSEGSAANRESDLPMPEPLRMLRRRPGGNLREVDNVGELDPLSLRKSRSVGSLTTFSESMRSSYLYSGAQDSFGNAEVATSDFSQGRPEVFSVGNLAEKSKKRDVSFFENYSSKPIMRPSFELEAQKLAQIPDGDDDGGIESALLKLEGKYTEKPPRLSMDLRDQEQEPTYPPPPGADFVDPDSIGIAIGTPSVERRSIGAHHHLHATSTDSAANKTSSSHSRPSADQAGEGSKASRPDTAVHSFLSEGSDESYSSVPLLDRDLTDEGRSKRNTKAWTDRSVLQGSDDDLTPTEVDKRLEAQDGQQSDQKTASLTQTDPRQSQPTEDGGQSFLNDDSDHGSELSSELSSDDGLSDLVDTLPEFSPRTQLPVHPLGSPGQKPIAPYASVDEMLATDVDASPQPMIPELYEEQLLDPLPRRSSSVAPDLTQLYLHPAGSVEDPTGTTEILQNIPRPQAEEARSHSAHLPFILAFDSEVLAQQFTLIEKDALNEIDWKELVEMQWKDRARINCRSWVQFLRQADAQGVEVVIARFNIMVKWAISEIVLTQNIEERARCIIKYIHIAANCRRYRNFATLAQLTIALTSNEVGRLTKTWALVPPNDLRTLQELETLVTPTRNFYNLRAEMEAGSDTGCIPFVMIYTHDLLYNAQRPSEIASSPTTAPLVNFERCRIAAAVVKTLLRLLEASSQYNFRPIEGITERCLWMGALSDEEIRRHSHGLE